jgi:hypothetical protein
MPMRVSGVAQVKMKKVVCGNHTAALSWDGEVFVWGTGVFGEFLTPQKLSSTSTLKDIAVGGSFALALDKNGRLWTWGANASGELGVGDYEPRASPYLLERLQSKTVVSVSCGGSFAIALGVTHTTAGPGDQSKRLDNIDSVITHVLSCASHDSLDPCDNPTHNPTHDHDETFPQPSGSGIPSLPPLSSPFKTRELALGSEATSQPSQHFQTRQGFQPSQALKDRGRDAKQQQAEQPMEPQSISDINTAEIFSSVSQRDPHQPVHNQCDHDSCLQC